MDDFSRSHEIDKGEGSGSEQPSHRSLLSRARARAEALSNRGRGWVDHQQPGSVPGVAIGAWRRYQAVEGPLQSLLLTAYVLIAVVPALLVLEEYLDPRARDADCTPRAPL
jgi:hypothetical protein